MLAATSSRWSSRSSRRDAQEVGKHGLVTDPAVHDSVLARVTAEAAANRLERVNMTPSPITGATGNQEFFLLCISARARLKVAVLRVSQPTPTDLSHVALDLPHPAYPAPLT